MKTTILKQTGRFLSLVLILCCTLALNACSLFGEDFDASAYTRSFLDVISKSEFTEYAKITNCTEDEAKQQYDSLLDNNVSLLLSSITVSDETRQNLKNMFHTVYSKWNYEVGEAVKNDDDSYTVPVTLRKLTAFKGVLAETMTQTAKKAEDAKDLDDTAMYDLYYQTFIDLVNETVAKGEYGEPATVSVRVSRSEDQSTASYNVYVIDTDSITELYSAAMDMDLIQEEASSLVEAE